MLSRSIRDLLCRAAGGALLLLLCAQTVLGAANRVHHERSTALTGGACGPFATPLNPSSLQAAILRFRIEFAGFTSQARVYYTTDGTNPSASFGTPFGTTQIATAAYSCTYFDLSQQQTVDVVDAVIPAQAPGTTVRYIVGAWLASGGPEIFGNSGTCASCTACIQSTTPAPSGCADVFEYVVPALPTSTPTRTPTRSATPTFTATLTPSATRTWTASHTPTRTATASPTPTRTATPTLTPVLTPTRTPSRTGTATRTQTPTPSTTPTRTPTASFVSPSSLVVDPSVGGLSDGNGVLEPGESVQVRPAWRNVTGSPVPLTGAASGFGGPAGATYSLLDASADYGAIGPGATGSCAATSNCYSVSVTDAAVRPVAHWDAAFTETTGVDAAKVWTLHVGESFGDVARSSPFYRFVETMFHEGVTGGCGPGLFCPGGPVTRGQMAVFLLVAQRGAGYEPPPATGTVFNDVSAGSFAAAFIERLVVDGVTAGCGGGGYCPAAPVTRAQMAVFLLRVGHGPGYVPPPATGAVFGDVPADAFAAAWIERLFAEGVTGGCGGGNYCPDNPVTRGQMAVFLTTVVNLQLYGP